MCEGWRGGRRGAVSQVAERASKQAVDCQPSVRALVGLALACHGRMHGGVGE